MILEARSKRSKCPQGWFPLTRLSLTCRRPSSPCLLTWSSLSARLVPAPSSYKDTSRIELGPTYDLIFGKGNGTWPHLTYLFKFPFSKYSHILRYWV